MTKLPECWLPQNPDFRRGGPAFSDAQNTILAEAFKLINSEGCKRFINETLAKHKVGEDVNSLDKLLNRATFGYFDLAKETYSPAELGLNFKDAMELIHLFHAVGASAVTTGDRLHVFLSEKVFERSSSFIPIQAWNRKADTPGYIVHELFHVAGIDKSIVDSQQMTNEIFQHCHLTGADHIIFRH